MGSMRVTGLSERGIAGIIYSTSDDGTAGIYYDAARCSDRGISVSNTTRFFWLVLDEGYSFADPANNVVDSITYEINQTSVKVPADGQLYDGKYRFLWDTSYKGTTEHPLSGTFKARQVFNTTDAIYASNYTVAVDVRTEGGTPTPPTKYMVTYSLTNATVSPMPETVSDGDSLTLTVTAEDGYALDGEPTLSYVTSNGTTTTVTGKSGVITATLSDLGESPNVLVTASASKVPTTYPITYSTENATVTPQPSTVTEGQTVTFTVAALSGYHFDATPDVTYMNASGSFTTVTAIGGEITVTFNNLSTTPLITLTAKATKDEEPTPEPTEWPVNYTVTNAIVSPMPETVHEGQAVAFSVAANEGYRFETTPEVLYLNLEGSFTYIQAVDGTINATFANLSTTDPRITLTATAVATGGITDRYGIVRVYEVDADDMKAIANYDANNVKGTTDLSRYISALRRFFADIPSDSTGDLRVGPYSIGRTVDYVNEDMVEYDCGSVTVTPRYGNAIDYKNATLTLWAPFVGEMTLPVDVCTGQTVALSYRCNVLSGDCLALVSVAGTVIQTATGNLSYPIPYEYDGNFNLSSNITIEANYMRRLTPYITVIESDMISNPRYIDDETPVSVGDCKGYCEFGDFELSGFDATRDEMTEIASLLRSGVIA